MIMLENLITDRTQADVDRWNTLRSKGWDAMTEDERAEWSAGMRGAYTPFVDMLRVQNAVDYLAETLNKYGYTTKLLPAQTWDETSMPTAEQLTDYLENVRRVRDVLGVQSSLPESMINLGYEGANEIERALIQVENTIEQVVKSMSRSNAFTFWSGNRPIPCAESNLGRTWAEFDAMNFKWSDLDNANWYIWAYGDPRKV